MGFGLVEYCDSNPKQVTEAQSSIHRHNWNVAAVKRALWDAMVVERSRQMMQWQASRKKKKNLVERGMMKEGEDVCVAMGGHCVGSDSVTVV